MGEGGRASAVVEATGPETAVARNPRSSVELAGKAASAAAPRERSTTASLVLGVDVGSTTVKVVAVDPETREIGWSRYERHETRQPEKTLELLEMLEADRPDLELASVRVFCTGSGSRPLEGPLGARFVQEVNAVTLAVEALHPECRSVVELGGQDAKIIVFREMPQSDELQAVASMNDKCASGTGATIDKCRIKVGLPEKALAEVRFDPQKLHHVAAKCGVFAETDVVNLIKAGIPETEVMASLADAIVYQNLSVLTRGNTLLPKVLLLGGPNTYLPFLQACWRHRIPETWRERGVSVPEGVPLDELIVVPENAEYYAAYGAALFGLCEPAAVGRYRGTEALRRFCDRGREAHLGAHAGPPLCQSPEEHRAFLERFELPPFRPARATAGQTVRAYCGLDGGSTSSKAVLLSPEGEVLHKAYQLSKGNPIQDMKELLAQLKESVEQRGARLCVLGFGVTGYAGEVIGRAVQADAQIVETIAHMQSAVAAFGEVDVVCDIGGQDIKVLFLRRGDVQSFRLSNQCSAGNGMLLQAMAEQLGVPLEGYADAAFEAKLSPIFSYGCAVFLDADRVNFQKEGYRKQELLSGLAQVLPKNIWQYVVQIPRMAELGTRFVLQGGTQRNLAALKAQVDYIESRVPGAEVFLHPHCGEAGAIGAALEARRVVERRGSSTFLGLDPAIAIRYTTRNDESTRCHFCANECARTFIDTETPEGGASRTIAGFSCERGTVESTEAMRALVEERRRLKSRHVNLVEYEARLAFRPFYTPQPLPEADTPIESVKVRRFLGGFKRKTVRRGFRRSSEEAAARRAKVRIGIPRALNLYGTAPFFRAYFEALGVARQNIVFSDATSEDMWREGAKYGSIDPCFPAKVCQSHLHNLLFKKHTAQRPLDAIFFPSITHLRSFVPGAKDTAACPVVAGTPNVMKAAFTKDIDYFEARGVTYLDPPLSFAEPLLLKRRLFETWGARLGVTEDESGFAAAEGWRALELFDQELERRGLEVLEQVEEERRLALLLLSRPYHGDPGINHGVLDAFQAEGYPVLSIRSIPKDPGWLARFFREDLDARRVGSPLEVSDVWPEAFSTNSVHKVWAAKLAARHPNLACLDLSSFKCGHDSPTYGLIDSIIQAGSTPYAALHDLDANKPSGSLKIRVQTYAYTLRRHEEDLRDRAARETELERRVHRKRRELLRQHRAALEARAQADPVARRALWELDQAYDAYLEEQEPVMGIRLENLDRPFPADAPEASKRDATTPRRPEERLIQISKLPGLDGGRVRSPEDRRAWTGGTPVPTKKDG